MIVTQYVLLSSRHLVTHLIYIHFCVWLGLFVDRWWLKEVLYAPDFLWNCSTCVPVAAPGITRSPNKGLAVPRFRKRPEIDPPVSRYIYMNAAARGGGTSIRPTLSTTWLRRSLASEARRLDAHINGKLGSTLSPLTKKRIPGRPCCSLQLNRRSGAVVRCQAVKANSFGQVRSPIKKKNEEDRDWCHSSKPWLFATFASIFSSLRARSRCLPSFSSRRRLLG